MKLRIVILGVVVLIGVGLWLAWRTPPEDEYTPVAGTQKILIIGIDGIDWDRMQARFAEGGMPNLERLCRNGAAGILHSSYPFYSPVIWTSMATGKSEEKHGVHGFRAQWGVGADPGPGGDDGVAGSQLAGSNDREVKAFWNIFSDVGRTVGVLNWLVTWPAEEVNGYMLSSRTGLHVPMRRFIQDDAEQRDRLRAGVHPPELWDTVVGCRRGGETVTEDEIAEFLGSSEIFRDARKAKATERLANLYAGDLTMLNIAERLLEERPTDVTAVYFRGADIISHMYWKYMEPESWSKELDPLEVEALAPVIERYYERMDEMVGQLLEHRGPETTVIVCSDHGFAGHRGYPGFEGTDAMGLDMHREEGIIILEGPPVDAGVELKGASTIDLTPTVLALAGLPVARDMDGRVLIEALRPEFLDRHPPSFIDTYETGDDDGGGESESVSSPIDDEIMEQLRAIGYIN